MHLQKDVRGVVTYVMPKPVATTKQAAAAPKPVHQRSTTDVNDQYAARAADPAIKHVEEAQMAREATARQKADELARRKDQMLCAQRRRVWTDGVDAGSDDGIQAQEAVSDAEEGDGADAAAASAAAGVGRNSGVLEEDLFCGKKDWREEGIHVCGAAEEVNGMGVYATADGVLQPLGCSSSPRYRAFHLLPEQH